MASLGRAILEIVAEADGFFRDLDRIDGKIQHTGRGLREFGANATRIGGQLTAGLTMPIVALGAGASKLAIDFESSFAGVGKTVDGVMDDGGQLTEFGAELADQFLALSTTIPINVNELNKLGESAGQLGIKKENLIDFTRVVAGLGVATDLAGEEAASALARIANITQMPQEQFGLLGATIVGLGNNFATTESEIVEFGLRIAGAGSIAGLTEAQILGIGTAMSSVGVEAEAGGTSVQKVLLSMVEAVQAGGATLDGFAATAGMTSAEFASTFRDDAGGAFAAFVTGLGAQGESAIATLTALGLSDQRLVRSFLSLAGAGDLVTRAMGLANVEWEKGTALTAETTKRYATTESQLVLLLNQLQAVGKELGEALLPVFLSVVAGFQSFMPVLQWAIDLFTNLPAPIQAGIVAFGGILAALGPVLVVVGQITAGIGALLPYFPAIGTAVTGLMTVLSGPIGWIGAAVVGLGAIWMTWGDDITRVVTEAYAAVKEWLWDKLEPVISPLIPLLQSIGEMFGAFADVVIAVGERIGRLFISKVRDDWGRMTSFFDDTIGRIKRWIGSVPDALLPLLGPIGLVVAAFRHWDEITAIASAAYTAVKTWLLDRFQAVVDGIKAKVDAVTGFFRDMYTAVVGGSFVPDMIAGIGVEFGRLGDVMVAPAQGAVSITEGLFGSMMTSVTQMLTSGFDGWKQTLGNTLSQMLSQVVSSKGSFQSAFQSLMPGGGGGAPSIGGVSIPDPASIMFNEWLGAALGPHFNDATASAQMEVDSFLEGLAYQGKSVQEALDLGWGDGLSVEARDMLNLPGLGDGGLVRGPMVAEIGERGPELVTPLDRLGGLGGRMEVVVNLDGREIARNQVRHLPDALAFAGVMP